MADIKAQTTRGQMLGEKPPEVWVVYAPDGTSHQCSPVDAREILAAGLGYTTEPPAAVQALTGDNIVNAAYAQVTKREQQSEQQPEHDNAVAADETAVNAKTDDASRSDDAGSNSADGGSKAAASSRRKAGK